jgi:hypothetical protein
MKKTLTLLSIVLISIISFKAKAQAQDAPEYVKSYLGIMGGTSTPTGNFGSYDYANGKAGFAKAGITFGLNGAFYFYKNLAIAANLSFQDQGELTQDDAQNLANGYNSDFKKHNTEITTVGRYHNITFMAGPQYSFVYNKFTIDVGASAGLIKSFSTPAIAVVFENSTNTNLTLNQLSSGALAFAYGGSAALRYNIGGRWDLTLKGNYITSDGIAIENTNNNGTIGRFITKQPISAFQTTFGFTFHLE